MTIKIHILLLIFAIFGVRSEVGGGGGKNTSRRWTGAAFIFNYYLGREKISRSLWRFSICYSDFISCNQPPRNWMIWKMPKGIKHIFYCFITSSLALNVKLFHFYSSFLVLIRTEKPSPNIHFARLSPQPSALSAQCSVLSKLFPFILNHRT